MLNFCKFAPNLESIIVDEDEEAFLWELNEKNSISSILPKLKYINGFAIVLGKPADKQKEQDIREVWKHLWRVAGCFKLATTKEVAYEPYWYIMDELGCAVSHSDVPNVALYPLLYSPTNNFTSDVTTISVLCYIYYIS